MDKMKLLASQSLSIDNHNHKGSKVRTPLNNIIYTIPSISLSSPLLAPSPCTMGFLKYFRRRSKSSRRRPSNSTDASDLYINPSPPPSIPRFDVTRKLPRPVLVRIFSFLCPHVADNSYKTSEESMTEDGCMLCDMRDLSRCALVCKRWYSDAQRLL